MPYSPPSGSAVGLAFTSSSPYVTLGGDVNLEFDSSVVADIRAVGGWMSTAFGSTLISGSQYIDPGGIYTGWVSKRAVVYNDTTQHINMTDNEGLPPTSDTSTWIYQVSWTQYVYPESWDNAAYTSYNVKVRNAGAYNIPDGTNLILNWLGATYFPPDATNLIVEFGAVGYGYILGATLYEQTEWGTANVENASVGYQWIYPSGWNAASYGSVDISHVGPRTIYYVGGIAPGSVGSHLVSPRYIFPQSWANNSAVGTPQEVRDNKIRPVGLAQSNVFGTAYVAWEVQHIYPVGTAHSIYGTPVVTFRVREIAPNGIDSDEYGTLQISLARWLYPSGFETIEWGDLLSFNGRPIFAEGIKADVYGQPYVYLATQEVKPWGIPPGEIGAHWPWNFNQHLYHYWEYQVPLTEWGRKNYTFVENVNRVLAPSGWPSQRFGYTYVEKTRAIELATLGDQTLWGKDTFIDFAIRYRSLIGWDSSQFGRDVDTVVYNAARVVAPTGYPQTVFGHPNPVLNLNRWVLHHSGPTGETFGPETFVAFAIRYVYPTAIQSANAGKFIPPSIYYNPRPIAPTGFTGVVAAPYVFIHWNIIYPKTAQGDFRGNIGEPYIANFNKTIYGIGRPYDEYGQQAKIFNANTYLPLSGWNSNVYGHDTNISYRTKYIAPAPFSVPKIVQTHRAYLDTPGLPATQTLYPSSDFGGPAQGGMGINPYQYGLSSRFGLATTNSNSIYPWGISSGFSAPEPVLTKNEISPEYIDATGGIPVEEYGSESSPMFGNHEVIGARALFPDGIPSGNVDKDLPENQGSQVYTMGEPRVTPDYIFAPHPIFVVDWWRVAGHGNTKFPWFGHTRVDHKIRSVYPKWPTPGTTQPPAEVWGTPDVTLKIRKVLVEAVAPHTQFGWTRVIWPYTKYIRLDYPFSRGIAPIENFPSGLDYETSIAWVPPFDVTVSPPGCDPEAFYFTWGPMIPSPRIELFNREVAPTGIPHETRYPAGSVNLFTTNLPSGTVIGPWSPGAFTLAYSAFGVPLVGPPRRVYPQGFDSFHVGFGDNNAPYPDRNGFVSHKNRAVYPTGWLSEKGQYEELSGGWDTTKIRHALVSSGWKAPKGIPSNLTFGVPTIWDGLRNIYPSSLPSTYNVSSVVTVFHRVYPSGWESSTFGDVDRWEAGKIKPHGPDTSEVSHHARLDRVVAPDGVPSEAFGASRFAVPIYTNGIAELAFFGPSIINEWDCSFRVVAVQVDAGTGAVGSPTVTHV